MCYLSKSVAIGARSSLGSLSVRATSGLAHNDLINLKESKADVEGQLESPGFALETVVNASFVGVLDLTVGDINTELGASGVNLSVQFSDDGLSLESRIFGKNSWDDLEGDTELLDSVLVEAGLELGELLDFVGNVHFSGTGAGEDAGISDKRLDSINTVIDSALDIVELSESRATKDDSGHFVLLKVATEDSAPGAGDFHEAYFISVSHLLGGGALQLDNGGGTAGLADSLELPL